MALKLRASNGNNFCVVEVRRGRARGGDHVEMVNTTRLWYWKWKGREGKIIFSFIGLSSWRILQRGRNRKTLESRRKVPDAPLSIALESEERRNTGKDRLLQKCMRYWRNHRRHGLILVFWESDIVGASASSWKSEFNLHSYITSRDSPAKNESPVERHKKTRHWLTLALEGDSTGRNTSGKREKKGETH